jgi:hypothetical protein
MTDQQIALRDSIWYESPDQYEWLKTRSPREALQKIQKLLALTSFSSWNEVLLEIHVPTSAELARLGEYLEKPRGKADVWQWREQPLDLATLRSHQIEVDDVLAEALQSFGGARLRHWSSVYGMDWRGHHYLFWWKTEKTLPQEWLAFCERHLAVTIPAENNRHRVDLTLRAGHLLWLDGDTRALLPFQGDACYPQPQVWPSWPSTSDLTVSLSDSRMKLCARLPFLFDGADFRRYRALLAEALGYELPMTRFRALLVNDEGTGTYARKELPQRARPARHTKPGAHERRERRQARRHKIF